MKTTHIDALDGGKDTEDRSDAADAARYRHLRQFFRMYSADMSGNHFWVMQYRPVRGETPEHAIALDMEKHALPTEALP